MKQLIEIFLILVPLKSVENLAHVMYFDEWGKHMDRNDLEKLEKAYVLLAMAEQNDKMQNSNVLTSPDDLKTTGKIYGL